jgi:hypothetical protein
VGLHEIKIQSGASHIGSARNIAGPRASSIMIAIMITFFMAQQELQAQQAQQALAQALGVVHKPYLEHPHVCTCNLL